MGGLTGRYPRGAWLLASVLLIAIAVSSFNGAANPGSYRATFSDPLDGIVFLFLVNLPIDAFLVATALYFVYRAWGHDAGRTTGNTSMFVARIVVASVVVAAIGALIDFYAFYDRVSADSYSDAGRYAFWINHTDAFLGSPEFFMALVGIFVSIYAATFLLAGLDWKLSAIPALAITGLNPLAWIITTSDIRFVAFLIALLFAVFALTSFAALAYWHSHAFDDEALLGDRIHAQSDESRG